MELSDLYKLASSHIIFIFYIPYKQKNYIMYIMSNANGWLPFFIFEVADPVIFNLIVFFTLCIGWTEDVYKWI